MTTELAISDHLWWRPDRDRIILRADGGHSNLDPLAWTQSIWGGGSLSIRGQHPYHSRRSQVASRATAAADRHHHHWETNKSQHLIISTQLSRLSPINRDTRRYNGYGDGVCWRWR